METKVKFLSSCQQRQGVKRKIEFSKIRDEKNLPKLLPWETRYQHTMHDFLKKDQNKLVNQDKIDHSDNALYKNTSSSECTKNQVVDNMRAPFVGKNLERKVDLVPKKSTAFNLELLTKYGDKYVDNLRNNECIDSDFRFLKKIGSESEVGNLKICSDYDDLSLERESRDGLDICSEFKDVDNLMNGKYSDFRSNWNNINVVDNDHLYNVPSEFRVKSSVKSTPCSQMANSLRIPFEIGSLRYKVEDLDKLFSLTDSSS